MVAETEGLLGGQRGVGGGRVGVGAGGGRLYERNDHVTPREDFWDSWCDDARGRWLDGRVCLDLN